MSAFTSSHYVSLSTSLRATDISFEKCIIKRTTFISPNTHLRILFDAAGLSLKHWHPLKQRTTVRVTKKKGPSWTFVRLKRMNQIYKSVCVSEKVDQIKTCVTTVRVTKMNQS